MFPRGSSSRCPPLRQGHLEARFGGGMWMELFCPIGLVGKELVSVWPGAPGTRFDSSQHPCGYIAGISDDGSRKGHPWLRR